MDPAHEYRRVAEAVDYISARLSAIPRIGLILGTGLGRIMNGLPVETEISMAWVPGMIPPGVTSHSGKIFAAHWHDQAMVIFAGRVHYYEGHDMADVVRSVRILKGLGCTHLITTNAAGGIHPSYEAGETVLIRDHINLMHPHPLRGPNEDRWGPRFPDMSEAYDLAWLGRTLDLAETEGLALRTGVYAGLTGPSLETPAEYRFLHTIGADLVGMSTVPEVIAARHMDMRVLGLSVVSNMCYPPERIVKTTVEDVIRTVEAGAETARTAVSAAIRGFQAGVTA